MDYKPFLGSDPDVTEEQVIAEIERAIDANDFEEIEL